MRKRVGEGYEGRGKLHEDTTKWDKARDPGIRNFVWTPWMDKELILRPPAGFI
jgi:hypothetical protein